jgi:transcription-repair coupling factor (superfamily II helicase)
VSSIQLKGLSGSSSALLFLACYKKTGGRHIIILPEKEIAAYFFTDLTNAGTEENLFFFPSSYKRSVQYGQTEEANIVMRTKTLEKLGSGIENAIIVTYPEALIEKVIAREMLFNHIFELKKGDKIDTGFLNELLQTYNFTETDFVFSPGQYAVRGSIIDVFSYSSALPYRIDFFGDEVESVRSFDVDTQLSVEMFNSIKIIPNIQWEQGRGEKRTAFTEYCTGAAIWAEDLKLVVHLMNEVYEKVELNNETIPSREKFLINGDMLLNSIEKSTLIEMGMKLKIPDETFTFSTSPQIPVQKNFSLLANILKQNAANGYKNIILSDNEKQIERIKAIFEETDPGINFTPVLRSMYKGFSDSDLRVSIFTDHQIFDRYYKFRLKDQFLRKESLALKELQTLIPVIMLYMLIMELAFSEDLKLQRSAAGNRSLCGWCIGIMTFCS